jgi:Glycosyltransferase Family 4
MPLKVLITNNRLAKRTGTEMFALELAEELLRRGERPAIFSPHLGPLAEEARRRTIPVAARWDQLGFVPDVIHGHHAYEVVSACLRFPTAPAVFVCHGWSSPADEPPRLPRIRRYVAVDLTCRDRLVCEGGIAEELVEVHPNFVNLRRFQPRPPLPDQPCRAVLFTNRGRLGTHITTIRRACLSRDIELDLLGRVAGRSCDRPEEVLGQYDVVFARAKSAIEAMAVGAAVVLCDRRGMGPLVTSAEFDQLRPLNFGRRTLARPLTVDNLCAELDRYDPQDAAAVSRRIRQVAPLTLAVDRWLDLYHTVISEHAAQPTDPAADLVALAAYFESVRPLLERGGRTTAWEQSARVLRLAAGTATKTCTAPARWLSGQLRRAA